MYKDLRQKTKYPKELLKFTNLEFVDKMRLTINIFDNVFKIDRKGFGGQYTENEKNFLYNFLLSIVRPKGIIEFSPFCGYTTSIMASAAHNAGGYDFINTYEMEPKCHEITKKNMQHNGFDHIEVVLGDVFEKIDIEKLKKCDVLFIDSDHSGEFAKRYVDEFFPLLKKGCFIFVHDVWFEPVNPETEVILSFIKDRNIKDYLYIADLLKVYDVPDIAENPFNVKEIEPTTSFLLRV